MSPTIKIPKGFSLVELMIGLSLGLIGMLIVSQVLNLSGKYQTTISAAGEAQAIGNFSLYTIERELKQAGFGITNPTLLGCQLNAYDNSVTPVNVIARTLYPVDIQDSASADGVSDTLAVAYGTSEIRIGPVVLVNAYDGSNADLNIQNRFGFLTGDFFLLGELTTPATPCVLGQISSLPLPSNGTAVSHKPLDNNITYRYNTSTGSGTSFNANVGEIFDLGKKFNINTYSVNANRQLVQQSALTGTSLVIADNVLAFKALYGHDTNADGTVDTWDTVIPANAAGWAATTNVRMGMAVKSPQREPGLVTGSPLSLWPNGPAITLSAEDQHYRYRTYNVVVPLGNMIWRSF
jgi:type IV pilus assembly protein PilW